MAVGVCGSSPQIALIFFSAGVLPGKSHEHGALWATVHGVEGAPAGNHNSHQTEGIP